MLFFIGDYVICLIYKCFDFIQQKYAFIPKNDNIASSFLEKRCKKGIEIVEKSCKNASLDAAMKSFPEKIGRAVVFCKSNVFEKDGVLYLPLYMAMLL